MSECRFYFDENVELAISEQLTKSGIDAVSARSLDKLSDSDANHLIRSTEMGYVFCTYDDDFLRLAYTIDHAGIIFAQQRKASIGDWVREIRAIHGRYTDEGLIAQVIFLPIRV